MYFEITLKTGNNKKSHKNNKRCECCEQSSANILKQISKCLTKCNSFRVILFSCSMFIIHKVL